MSKRTVQSFCIVLVFLMGAAIVLFLGIRQGKSVSLETHGVELENKTAWEASLPSSEDPIAGSVVYVTESGTKYHATANCSSLKRAKVIIGTPLSNAEQKGKEPCSICYKKRT